MEKIQCECGCGAEIKGGRDTRDRKKRFAKGHGTRGRKLSEEHKEKISNTLQKKYDSGKLDYQRSILQRLRTKDGRATYKKRAYEYYGKKCNRCGKKGVLKPYWKTRVKVMRITLEVHHKIPSKYGGTHELDNLEVLCQKCHKAEERRIYEEMRKLYFTVLKNNLL